MVLTTSLLLPLKCLPDLVLVIAALVRDAIRRWLTALAPAGLALATVLDAIFRQ